MQAPWKQHFSSHDLTNHYILVLMQKPCFPLRFTYSSRKETLPSLLATADSPVILFSEVFGACSTNAFTIASEIPKHLSSKHPSYLTCPLQPPSLTFHKNNPLRYHTWCLNSENLNSNVRIPGQISNLWSILNEFKEGSQSLHLYGPWFGLDWEPCHLVLNSLSVC